MASWASVLSGAGAGQTCRADPPLLGRTCRSLLPQPAQFAVSVGKQTDDQGGYRRRDRDCLPRRLVGQGPVGRVSPCGRHRDRAARSRPRDLFRVGGQRNRASTPLGPTPPRRRLALTPAVRRQ